MNDETPMDEAVAQWTAAAESYSEETGIEAGLKLIEDASRILERNDLPLEQTLAVYEKSIAVTAQLQKRLSEARQKIEQLLPGGETVPTEMPED